MPLVLLVVSIVVATIAGRAGPRAPGQPPVRVMSTFIDMLLVGLLVGRGVFVLQWLPLYRADPWSILRPGDGGYSVWAGVLAALACGVWVTRRDDLRRRSLVFGTLAGLATWALLAGSIALLERAYVRLPPAPLTRLEGGSVQLSTLSDQPIVVNLWATWCPPCRREMPVLAQAQRAHPDVTFAFVNQGEGAADIRRYLQSGSLQLHNVMLDPFFSVSQATGARGLPTTLFFDREGRMVDTHVGELTPAGLAHKLRRLARATGQP